MVETLFSPLLIAEKLGENADGDEMLRDKTLPWKSYGTCNNLTHSDNAERHYEQMSELYYL
jgi:hypothetical protein